MFGGSKKANNSVGSTDIETIIGRNTSFKGTVSGDGNIRIDGKLEGEITVSGVVVIGEQGEVTANIKATDVLISGSIKGNIDVREKLEITGTGKLYGDVKASVLSISEGAVFRGSSLMEPSKHPVQKDVLAPPAKD